jgi:hypothetical protein
MKVECPLCNKPVSEAGIGKHILSQQHRAHITEESSKMGKPSYEKSLESKLKARVILEYKKYGSASRYCCFNCCSSTMYPDASHFDKHPECFENHKRLLKKFIEHFGVVESEGIPVDNKMKADNEKLKQKNERLQNTIELYKKQIQRFAYIIKKTTGIEDAEGTGFVEFLKEGISKGSFSFPNIQKAYSEAGYNECCTDYEKEYDSEYEE